jgi:hypothetical protein
VAGHKLARVLPQHMLGSEEGHCCHVRRDMGWHCWEWWLRRITSAALYVCICGCPHIQPGHTWRLLHTTWKGHTLLYQIQTTGKSSIDA